VIKLSPHRLQPSAQATVTNTTPTVSTPSTSDAEKLKTDAEAKKKEREAASLEMYNKFIDTINNCNFKTKTPNETPNEASYIKFSKFIQEIMDLQFSIKDDIIRKKAQNITDQILTAYSALISYYCSKTFLREHFEEYMKKLNIQDSVKITDPKLPTPKIDDKDDKVNQTIIAKLSELAKNQKCNAPPSQPLAEKPATKSYFTFTLPTFPSFFKKSSDSSTTRDTELPEFTGQTSATSAVKEPDSNPLSFHSFHPEEEEEEEDDEGNTIHGVPLDELPAVRRSIVPPHPTRSSQ
jgi:hypothetical protein